MFKKDDVIITLKTAVRVRPGLLRGYEPELTDEELIKYVKNSVHTEFAYEGNTALIFLRIPKEKQTAFLKDVDNVKVSIKKESEITPTLQTISDKKETHLRNLENIKEGINSGMGK